MSPRYLPKGEELDVDWERWADGRPWRLKRKRDFPDVNPKLGEEASMNAAKRLRKVVRTAGDRGYPEKYFWLQFADHEIALGEPCPCGSRRILRLHTYFARCAECDAQLVLSGVGSVDDDEDDEEDDIESERDERTRGPGILGGLEEVYLSLVERSDSQASYRGHGLKDRVPVLVAAELRVSPGEELKAEQVADRIVQVYIVPFHLLTGMVDPAALLDRGESEWDLVL